MSYVFRGKRDPEPAENRCGTYAGYSAHRRKNEKPCTDCSKAHTKYTREYRRSQGITKSTLVPLETECPNCGHHINEEAA